MYINPDLSIGGEIMGDIKEIKSIPVVSFALIVALVLAVLMFIIGIFMSLLGISMFSMMQGSGFMRFGAAYAIYMIVIMPIITFIIGFIVSAVAAIIYNVLAPRIGGIKLELE